MDDFAQEFPVPSTAGLPILWTHTKKQFGKEPEGLRQFRDHSWKALGEENPNLL